jgi:hypothetical protein
MCHSNFRACLPDRRRRIRKTSLRNRMFRHKRPLIYNAIRSLTLMQLAATLFSFLVNFFAFLDLGFAAKDRAENKK